MELNTAATYKIYFTPSNAISSSGSIVIGWPSQVTITSSVKCTVTTTQRFVSNCEISVSKRTITITEVFEKTDYYSQSIAIELYPVINPKDNRLVNGFTIKTYDDANQKYQID